MKKTTKKIRKRISSWQAIKQEDRVSEKLPAASSPSFWQKQTNKLDEKVFHKSHAMQAKL